MFDALTKYSLLLAVIGIVALFLITMVVEPKHTTVNELSEGMLGQNVVVNGTATKFVYANGNYNIDLTYENKAISVVVFEQNTKDVDVDIRENDTIEVSGKLERYRGALEIVAVKILKK